MSKTFTGIGLISIAFLTGVLIKAANAAEGSTKGNPTERSTDDTSKTGENRARVKPKAASRGSDVGRSSNSDSGNSVPKLRRPSSGSDVGNSVSREDGENRGRVNPKPVSAGSDLGNSSGSSSRPTPQTQHSETGNSASGQDDDNRVRGRKPRRDSDSQKEPADDE